MQPRTSITLSRRRFTVVVPLTCATGAWVGCRKNEPNSCASGPELSLDETQQRATLGYVDRSPDPTKTCEKCTQYLPAPTADQCGGCSVMRGPIHPQGTCKVYTRMA